MTMRSLVLEGRLRFHQAVAVVASAARGEGLPLLRRDSQGRVSLPGASLQALVTEALTRIYGREVAAGRLQQWLVGEAGEPARVQFHEAQSEAAITLDSRPRLALNRDHAAARLSVPHDSLPAGSELPLKISVTSSAEGDDMSFAVELMQWLHLLLAGGWLAQGASGDLGLGVVTLEQARLVLETPANKKGAKATSTVMNEVSLPAPRPVAGGLVVLRAHLQLEFNDGVLVQAGPAGGPVALPVSRQYYLPASSLRGALRAASETLWRQRGQAVSQAHGVTTASKKKSAKAADPGLPPAQCPVARLFGGPGLHSPLRFTDFIFSAGTPQAMTRAAINRFSGGAEADRQFAELPLLGARGQGRLLLRDPAVWQLNVLAHLALQVSEGQLWIGHGTRRGLGRLTGMALDSLDILATSPSVALPACLRPEAGQVIRRFTANDWPLGELLQELEGQIQAPTVTA